MSQGGGGNIIEAMLGAMLVRKSTRRVAHVVGVVAVVAWCGLANEAVAAKNPPGYAIAAAHPLAVSAGEAIFAAGGNAFDAAVAVSAVLAVVEPYSSGLGGGGFWLLHQASGEASNARDAMLDGRETAPGAARRDMYLDADGQVIEGKSLNEPAAAGIPGTPAALDHIARKYGRLPLAKTLAAAIRYAEEGFAVHAGYVAAVKRRLDVLRRSPEARRIFLDRDRVPTVGWRLKQPDLANTLRALARSGRAGFYRGEVAKRMVEAVRAANGYWTLEDLAQYAVREREPIVFEYAGARIVSAPPPSSGGVALAEMFNMLSLLPAPQTSAQRAHQITEVMRRAYRDRAQWLGDSDFFRVPIARLTSMAHARKVLADYSATRATPSEKLSAYSPSGRDTTHFSIIDAAGNRVAATMSINYGFGCGFVAGASGVLLNNEMDDFAIKAGAPNVYGLVGGEANAIEPGKRMLSSMSPTFIDDGQRVALIGTPGGSRIITMVMLAALKFLDGGSARDIVSLPRFHHQYLPDRLQFEPRAFDDATRHALTAMGHTLQPIDRAYGDMHVVVWNYRAQTLDVAADPRGHGVAVVAPR